MAKRSSEYNDLLKEYKRLAKRADQRLVRLEELSQKKGFKNVLSWAYQKAQRSIHQWSGSEASRFNTKAPGKISSLRAKIRDIKSFLGMKSSTKKGIISTYKKRADTLNANNGTNFTWEDMGKFFESAEWEKMEREYGSKTAVMAVGQIQQNEDSIIESIEAGRESNLKIPNKKVKSTVEDLISKYGLGVTDLY